jgi:HAMP domain-containing protein/HPt (histidine-containing phosphotransfer) domain-containing protein
MSLRVKLVRTMIGVVSLIAAAVLVTVTILNVRTERKTLALVESTIEDSILRKGKSLVAQHARALQVLVADNAFGDVKRLVEGSVREDAELLYGLFLSSDLQPWAYLGDRADFAKQSWKALGVDVSYLTRGAVRSERRSVFSEDVFQFSAPVVDEDQRIVGLVVYGASSEPLRQALAGARADSRRSLLTTVGLIGLLALATILLGLILVRRSAARITQPLSDLTRAAAAIAGGDRTIQVSIRSRDELETLGNTFNAMVLDLRESYSQLEALNRTLEEKVEQRTAALLRRNRDMRMVLDTVHDGLLTLSREGVMADERSAMIDRWFGGYGAGTLFVDFIGRHNPDFAEMFRLGYEAAVEDILPLELSLEQLPSSLHAEGRDYEVKYLPLVEGTIDQGLLVIVRDVTEQLLLRQHEAEQRELLAVFQGITHDRVGFVTFFDEACALVETLAAATTVTRTTKRIVHTLKGNAAGARLEIVARLCHQAEDEIDESGAGDEDTCVLVPSLAALRQRWGVLSQAVREFLGDRGRDAIELTADELNRLRVQVDGGLPAARISRCLARWLLEPAERPLRRLAEQGQALATRLGKGPVDVSVEAETLRLDHKRWSPLWSELSHVVRNAVDHGCELPEQRQLAGKDPTPRLSLRARIAERGFLIEIEDDGRGINWEAIRSSALRCGLAADTEEDLVAALFADGVSTRDAISATSGRGVGMAAVRACVDELKGGIAVRSRAGLGTLWTFSFPVSALGPYEGTDVFVDARLASDTVAA